MFEVLRNPTIDQLETFKSVANWLFLLSATGVVLGVVFEGKSFSSRVNEFGWKLLVASLGLELVFTVVIFGIDEQAARSQRAEIISLQKRLAFRSLSETQFNDLVEQLKPASGQHFDIVTYWKNPEALAITGRIYDALIKAGWVYDKPETGEFILGVDTGVSVAFDKREGSAVKASKVLIYALLTNEIYASEDQDSLTRTMPDNVPITNKLTITVGIKP